MALQGYDAHSSNTDDDSSTTRNSSNRLHQAPPWKDRNVSSSDQVANIDTSTHHTNLDSGF